MPLDLVRECVEVAVQAPTGSNMQGWHFVVVTDEAKRRALGDIYRQAFELYRGLPIAAGNIVTGDAERDATLQRVMSSAEYLGLHMGDAPVLVLPCIDGRVDGQRHSRHE